MLLWLKYSKFSFSFYERYTILPYISIVYIFTLLCNTKPEFISPVCGLESTDQTFYILVLHPFCGPVISASAVSAAKKSAFLDSTCDGLCSLFFYDKLVLLNMTSSHTHCPKWLTLTFRVVNNIVLCICTTFLLFIFWLMSTDFVYVFASWE